MKTQAPNAAQGELGYREVLQNSAFLFHEKKPDRRQIERLIRMATSCSKSSNLQGTKKKEMKEIADTWKKLLDQLQKERKEK